MPRVAFVTSLQHPQLTADDRLAVLELERAGIHVLPAIWSDYNIDWTSYDLVVLRSMWDYHLHVEEFFRWLNRLDAARARVWNPVALARWNADKRYLRDLRDRGVEIVPTLWFERAEHPALLETMEEQGWREAVVKPVISSTGFCTWRVRIEEARACQAEFHSLLAERPVMLQQFQPVIMTEGEWSLVYMGGELSHTVLKRALPGDFRVQEEFGGTTRLATADADAVELAWRAIGATASEWVYARIDGVRTKDGFRLMELEMLEPGLFLLDEPEAARRFARAIRALLRSA